MVGASLKSRSSVESCWFSVRTTPRSRGEDFKTQNRKEQVRTHSISELPNLSQKPGRLARKNIGTAEKAFCGQRGRPAPPKSIRGPAAGHWWVILTKGGRMVFHTMEKLSSPGFRLSLFVVVCFMVLLPQGSPLPPPGGAKKFQAARRWISSGVQYFKA